VVDEQFGELTWDDLGEVWATPVAIPFFLDFGRNLTPGPEDEPEEAPGRSPGGTPDRPEMTLGQVRAREALDAQMAILPPDQREILGAMLAATEAGVARSDFQPPMESEADDPLDPEALFRQGRFLLQIDTGSPRKHPSPAQRRAWQRVMERGEALWDELMVRLLEEYQLQQPIRAWWWRTVYGDYHLRRALPEASDVGALKDLIRPSSVRIERSASKAETAEISIDVACTWNRDDLEVRIRDGEVAGITSGVPLFAWEQSARKKLRHPVFGPLARRDENAPWSGTVVFEPFRQYLALIAEQRASFRHDRASHGLPKSVMPWDFVHGRFELRAHARPGERPTEGQAKALASFKQHEAGNAAAIVQSIYEHYQKVYEVARREYLDRYAEENVPRPTSIEILHDRLQLYAVHVFPEDGEGRVKLGFLFVCLWNPGPNPDLGVRWCDGRVKALGSKEVGQP
jgi:uncharacterized protein DUF6985